MGHERVVKRINLLASVGQQRGGCHTNRNRVCLFQVQADRTRPICVLLLLGGSRTSNPALDFLVVVGGGGGPLPYRAMRHFCLLAVVKPIRIQEAVTFLFLLVLVLVLVLVFRAQENCCSCGRRGGTCG